MIHVRHEEADYDSNTTERYRRQEYGLVCISTCDVIRPYSGRFDVSGYAWDCGEGSRSANGDGIQEGGDGRGGQAGLDQKWRHLGGNRLFETVGEDEGVNGGGDGGDGGAHGACYTDGGANLALVVDADGC